jgi:Protein of unknown function (DUF1524)
MKTVVPNNEVFKSSFETASASRMHLVRYYLRALELYLKEDPNPAFVPSEDPKAINTEHILPITPGPDWHVDPDVAATYHKRLGNMVLLEAMKNTKIGNKSFYEKRQAFEESPYITTQEVLKYTDWGPEEIRKRQERLAVLAPKVWPI